MTKRPHYQPDNGVPFGAILCVAFAAAMLVAGYLDGSSIRDRKQLDTQQEVSKP